MPSISSINQASSGWERDICPVRGGQIPFASTRSARSLAPVPNDGRNQNEQVAAKDARTTQTPTPNSASQTQKFNESVVMISTLRTPGSLRSTTRYKQQNSDERGANFIGTGKPTCGTCSLT
ncbi:hypothetical protein TYRP_016724 [Tyrophagus putrescentiae]|nr:hypothetical protein TYRP_016724 [Tyrophagus putrescentiae]